ncbi:MULTISPECIES: ester cyclase [unclassified Sulfitobacter]|uniref:ester cyclase n=2 Tax=Sulfitobacter TaxID=60136 RepID=UPI0007C27A83|nr:MULTISPECIES: ester cyclase [unclassified Sulfitobacter]KZY04279.1 polyketide cyclase [Sulfitobacter sp. HI0023]KZY24132.1 polyketide cyclase [Sulfitobacter sp. HI0040]KZZ70635.1 polyketide cyclase [Sulfitobacter sp. HI0129]
MDVHSANKDLIATLRAAMYDFDEATVRKALADVSTSDTLFRLCHPFGDSTGPEAFYNTAYRDLLDAWPDLERRDYIVMAGPDQDGANWVGCGGYYTGVFTGPWLDIPPTGHQVTVRFHEFYRIEDGKVIEVQALWDIPEVMMQAGVWPMAPSLGLEFHVPGPATQDGLVPGPFDVDKARASQQHIIDMLACLKKYPSQGGPEVMELERYWHPRMNWYGPSGIGTARGIAGFRNWHQIPFLTAMPDRGQHSDETHHHFFGDGAYAGVTGWPNMAQTVKHGGWLSIAPSDRKITMRSLDFWRLENGRIRENWVLVDLLHVYDQLGVDVFARLREFNKARNIGRITIPDGMSQ